MTQKREKTFVAGLSMGGYGAFKWALKSNRFSYAASFSGALDFSPETLLEGQIGEPAYWQGVFGAFDDPNLERHYLKTMVSESDRKTKFYAWCGYEDFLLPLMKKLLLIFELKVLTLTIIKVMVNMSGTIGTNN